jgi:hypothetical protein
MSRPCENLSPTGYWTLKPVLVALVPVLCQWFTGSRLPTLSGQGFTIRSFQLQSPMSCGPCPILEQTVL